ncbi:MAG: hypothetical protein P4L66_15015 [Acetobacteraceae bacterium]|nr:hypothetical protein [Acetobacteraceae bacterium]
MTPACPITTRSVAAGVVADGKVEALNGDAVALKVPLDRLRFAPTAMFSTPPLPDEMRPSNCPAVRASVGCKPAVICEMEAARVTPPWLIGTRSLLAAAIAKGRSGIVVMGD